jgi:hypothetical protein
VNLCLKISVKTMHTNRYIYNHLVFVLGFLICHIYIGFPTSQHTLFLSCHVYGLYLAYITVEETIQCHKLGILTHRSRKCFGKYSSIIHFVILPWYIAFQNFCYNLLELESRCEFLQCWFMIFFGISILPFMLGL